MTTEECKKCKIGDEHLRNYQERKEKKISFLEMTKREIKLGARCSVCMYNGIGGKRARKLLKKIPNFQSLDMLDPREDSDGTIQK